MLNLKVLILSRFEKLMTFTLIFFLTYFLYLYFNQDLVMFVQNHSWMSEYYNYFYTEISAGSFVGIFYITFIATLFFLFIPTDMIVAGYMVSGVNPITILGGYFLGAFCGVCINYWIGYFIGSWGLQRILGDRHEKYNSKINKYGMGLVFVSNVLPAPEIVNTVYGGFRYPFFKCIATAMLGKMIKCCVILSGSNYISEQIERIF
ncbi:MAG: VTT domain-containing protein [Candidatus Aenigmarchaeota archaeon]|nr:VTT domain-containing protein [Candidatus Aenigmarchaeota archaeon]